MRVSLGRRTALTFSLQDALQEQALLSGSGGATIGISGAGGPDPQDGRRPGTVCFGLVAPAGEWEEETFLPGDPAQVVARVQEMLKARLEATGTELRLPRPLPTVRGDRVLLGAR